MIGIHFFPPSNTGLAVEPTTRYGFVEINGNLWLMYERSDNRNLHTANKVAAGWNDFANLGLCGGASAITTRNAPGINDNQNHVNMVFLTDTGPGLNHFELTHAWTVIGDGVGWTTSKQGVLPSSAPTIVSTTNNNNELDVFFNVRISPNDPSKTTLIHRWTRNGAQNWSQEDLNVITPDAFFCAPAAVALGNKIYVFYAQPTRLINTFAIQSKVWNGTSWVGGSDPQITLTVEPSMPAACPIPNSNALALFYIPTGSDVVSFKTMTSDGLWSDEQTLPSLPTSFAGGQVAACHNTTTGRIELCASENATNHIWHATGDAFSS